MKNSEIMSELINFTAVSIIFIISLAIIFNIFCKKFKFQEKNIELYGLLLDLNTTSLISISAQTINYLFLVWCTISFKGLNIIYIAFTTILVIISDAVNDNFKKLPISLLLTIFNCLSIQVIYLLYNYLTTVAFSYPLLLILFLVILFVFLYYTYNLFRQINNAVVKHRFLKEKKYKL